MELLKNRPVGEGKHNLLELIQSGRALSGVDGKGRLC